MKALIIRFSSIGDIVLTSPVLRCLKQQLPDCEIHFVTKPQYKSLVENNPNVSKVHLLERTLWQLGILLRKEHFDVVIDLHNNVRSRLLRFMLARKSLVVKKLNLQKRRMILTNDTKTPLRHFSERCLDAVASLGVKNDFKGLDYFIPDEEHVPHHELHELQQSGYVAFGIGAWHFTKRLPPEKLIAVCGSISQPVILLGDMGDYEIGQQVALACGRKVANACGKFTINQTASVIQQSRVVISHDSAVMHIAAALNKPVVSIWGNTVPEFGMHPYFGQDGMSHPLSETIEVPNLSCRPCSRIGYKECPKGHFKCMREISEDAVAAAVDRFWRAVTSVNN